MANTDVITEYREHRKKGEQLAAAARKQMQGRYMALLTEAADIQSEYKSAFNAVPEVPAGIKAFTLGEVKKPEPTEAASKGKKIGGLRRSLTAAVKKHDGTRIDELTKQLADLGVTDTGLTPEAPAPAPAAEPEF